ncbi:hypothetical protein GGX14DRAFT_696497 [Mycena pura]|uniref:Uncharacterized protein n=1 Tax=Mycena pura TaxID=153505 RepID=A0AAD6VPC6_9AGAR|nr:hypothetical protein GGX14DRAFT_696497 [Mycena pura]
MAPSATLPLSTTFIPELDKSVLSLDWVLASGIKASASKASGVLSLPCTINMNVHVVIKDSLPFDLVLGRDWNLFCCDSVPNVRFVLSSGMLDLTPQAPLAIHPPDDCPMDVDAELDPESPHAMFLLSHLAISLPQSLKDKIIKLFRAKRFLFCVAENMFKSEILKRPDITMDEDLLLDRYKWLHPDCIPNAAGQRWSAQGSSP